MNQALKEASVKNFRLTPTQYELFTFTATRPATLVIGHSKIATAPVNLLLLDHDGRAEYERGNVTAAYRAAWGRRSYLEAEEEVEPGTWYLVEGGPELSSGRVEVLQKRVPR
jgi:hypothetical protein